MDDKKHNWLVRNFQSYDEFLLFKYLKKLEEKCKEISHEQFLNYLVNKKWEITAEEESFTVLRLKDHGIYISKSEHYSDYGKFNLMQIKEISLIEKRSVKHIIKNILDF